MGWDTNELEESGVLDIYDLTHNCFIALNVFNSLTDVFAGMAGVWVGKDYSGLGDILDIYKIESIYNRRRIFELIQVCKEETGKHYMAEQKRQERQHKS